LASELSSIPGLMPKHVALLAGTLQVGTAQQLAGADAKAIHAAMRKMRPAPTLAAISAWQEHARERVGAKPAPPVKSRKARQAGWEQAAAFVVSFETRRAGTDQDHRLVVEQVEQAPPEPRQEWAGWSTESAWTWMLDRAMPKNGAEVQLEAKREPVTDRPGRNRKGSAVARGMPPRITAGVPELALADGGVRRLDASGRTVDVPGQATLRVSASCEQGMKLHVALRLRRADAVSDAPVPPVTVVSGKTAEIALQDLPPGEHSAVLAIWAPRGRAAAAVIPLPRLRVPEA
jgi:hypothetical protein